MKPADATPLIVEMLRRKGHTLESARTLGPQWFTVLTWSPAEAADFRKWAMAELRRQGLRGRRAAQAYSWFNLEYGLRDAIATTETGAS